MTTCRACGARTDPVFEMEPMPLAAAFAPTRDEALASPKYPLTWHRCRRCELVNVAPVISGDVLFRHYHYASSTVPALVRHHEEFARFLRRRRRRGSPTRLLEIGCNDGVLLRRLPGWERVGVDPSDIARRASDNQPWTLINEGFASGMGLGSFDLVVSSNAFAHFPGLSDALDGVREALTSEGEAWIEVHDLAATLATGQWDTVYHEHGAEWSAESLWNAGALHGLHLFYVDRLPLHGGLLRAGFRLRGYNPRQRSVADFGPLQRAYDGRRALPLPPGSVAYGAAARASVYLNQVPTAVNAVIDGSPVRQGKYVPGVGLPILSPAEFGTQPAAIITAWNHADDIRARHPGYAGQWVTAW